ncbi:MAG: NIPSNAP family containing protein [Proteobacteria bacterium]|nr:NIPSNAP family containing protein [Pseudomonadota bacterium]
MPNHKLYIHEFIDIIGHNRAKYMHHMTANWSPIAQRERNQLCYGVWGVVGTTRGWPEVINLWEEDGWQGQASSFRHEFNHPGLQNPSLAEWWAEAAKYRRHGDDRLLVPAPWTRTIEELCANGVRGECYAHEQVKLIPGGSREYLARVRDRGVPSYGKFGWELAGAFETAMVNDSECFVIWAIPSWEQWAEFESAQRSDAGLLDWRAGIRDLAVDWHRCLLVDAPLSPLRTGRQPLESDRRPLGEIP